MSVSARPLLLLVAALLTTSSGCTEHDPEIDRVGPPYDAGTLNCDLPSKPGAQFPCEVDAILQARCRRCHQEPQKNGAPFPLLKWEHTQADYGGPIYEAMYRAIKTNFMPYCAEGTSCAGTVKDGLGPVIPLSEEQKKTMLDWLVCPQPVFNVTCP